MHQPKGTVGLCPEPSCFGAPSAGVVSGSLTATVGIWACRRLMQLVECLHCEPAHLLLCLYGPKWGSQKHLVVASQITTRYFQVPHIACGTTSTWFALAAVTMAVGEWGPSREGGYGPHRNAALWTPSLLGPGLDVEWDPSEPWV